jgi:histidinol dehydrogenase
MKKLDTIEKNFEKEFGLLLKTRAVFRMEVMETVKTVFDALEKRGEAALLEFAKKFEKFEGKFFDLKVRPEELNAAKKSLTPKAIRAIETAARRIEKFHKLQVPKSFCINEDGGRLECRWTPLNRVGLYIPGGKAPLASTVLMSAIPARLAGVKEIALATPAGGGRIHPAVLYAAKVAGAKEIYKTGGAQAIAAFALGAGPIKKVDKIIGPGGVFVSAAKVYSQSLGLVGIDTLAGPSEIVILSDGSAPLSYALADLAAQLEHGEDGWAFMLSTSRKTLDEVAKQFVFPQKNLILVKVKNTKEMVDLANRIAPEHLEIHLKNPESVLDSLTGPSAIYVGAGSPVASGDYMAGPNHSLPTSGRARFDSPLGVWDFMKRQNVVSLSPALLKKIARPASDFAELEGLVHHSNSIKIR